MKKYIIANIAAGIYIEELEGNEKIYTDIDDFIDDLGQAATFELGNIAIKFTEENVKAIEEAGYTF